MAAKSAEVERLRGALDELLVSQTHAAAARKAAEARAAEAEANAATRGRDADARLAALRQALGAAESARADADANAGTYKSALLAAKEDCERLELECEVCKRDLARAREEAETAREAVRASEARAAASERKASARDEGGQAKLMMVQAEASELRAKVEKRNREVRELNQMLKAWEAMRHSKDAQIEKLVERCRAFEEEAKEKARAVESMRSRARNTPGSVGSGLGFPSGGAARRVALAPAVAAADKENPGSPGFAKLAKLGKKPAGSVSPASASLAAFKRASRVPRADAVPGFRERLDSVVGR